ncbi:MAG: hypothetical protein WAV15_00125 [Minisyncoccia bacterium]
MNGKGLENASPAVNPREQAIRDMLRGIAEIRTPLRIVPVSEVPEFAEDALAKGVVGTKVGQGQVGVVDNKPIRTDNVADCKIFIIKIPGGGGRNRYALAHIWAGDIDLNLEGHKREDVAKLVNKGSVAIGITGGRSNSIISAARQFKYEGVSTVKHIDAPSGNRYVSVVFRPESNEILIRVGADTDATEVLVYEGF